MSRFTKYNDQELWEWVTRGDQDAFAEFFHRRSAGIFVVTNKIINDELLAQDILQEVFIRAWKHRTALAQMEKPALWLLKTATNLSIDYLQERKQEAKQKILMTENYRGVNDGQLADQYFLNKEILSIVHEAMQQLPPQRRKVYQLSKEIGLDRKTIAAQMGISEHTVKNQLSAAIKFIQEFLSDRGITLAAYWYLTGLFWLADHPVIFFRFNSTS